MKGFSWRCILSWVLICACCIGWSGSPALAQQPKLSPEPRVALGGYDPITYFNPGRPEKGTAQFSFAFDDTVYWFKSSENRAAFVADPERFAPQYRGYCALTLAAGMKAEADPEAWSISNGKLYVFGAKIGTPTFNANSAEIIGKANLNWKKLQEPN